MTSQLYSYLVFSAVGEKYEYEDHGTAKINDLVYENALKKVGWKFMLIFGVMSLDLHEHNTHEYCH